MLFPLINHQKSLVHVRSSVPLTYSLSLFFTELKIYHLSLFNTHMTILTLLILAVYRMHVIHEPCVWSNSQRVLRSSVVRASDQCTEGHWFNSCREPRFFLCPVLVTCWSYHYSRGSFYCKPDYMTPRRLSRLREFTPVPSHGSIFVYMIPPQHVMPARVTLAWIHSGDSGTNRNVIM